MKFKELDRLLSRYRLVLASGSPRRVSLLRAAGINFRQLIPDIDENNHAHQDPSALAALLAQKKALAVCWEIETDEVILGCDTIVILNDLVLGKPESEAEAFEMLSALSGNRHTVCSAIALLERGGYMASGFEFTDVYFNPVSAAQIKAYIKTGEPLDKAGAYGIQEEGGFLVDRIEGNIDNVIGLPMSLLERLAGKFMTEMSCYGI
ncbi:MAG: Maf family protein [candidate division Zixibacteria bacterium]|nr:Maf family protein [candidate division Zixibacteria bacterium]